MLGRTTICILFRVELRYFASSVSMGHWQLTDVDSMRSIFPVLLQLPYLASFMLACSRRETSTCRDRQTRRRGMFVDCCGYAWRDESTRQRQVTNWRSGDTQSESLAEKECKSALAQASASDVYCTGCPHSILTYLNIFDSFSSFARFWQ